MLLFCGENLKNKLTKPSGKKEKRRSGILSQSIQFSGNEEYKKHPKTKDEENKIRQALEKNHFLVNILLDKRMQNIIDCMYEKQVFEGETLIEEGQVGSHLYISKTGTFKIDIRQKHVLTFSDVRVFGELAILYAARRHATVKATENGIVWVLDCLTFKKLMIKTAIEEQEEMVSFLKNVPTLNAASKEKLYQVANLLKTEFFPPLRTIVRQGDIGDKFYIIRAGTVTIMKDGVKVAELSKGQFFGELALLKDEFRHATVQADSPGADCLTLTRKHFISHFGGLEEFVKLKARLLSTAENTIAYKDVKLEDLNVLATIGVGGFGRVKLVQHKTFKSLVFALKCMKKMDFTEKSHRAQVYNEKNLQMACNSNFIVKVYRSFKDSKFIYLLQELCLGGDLWNLMRGQMNHQFEETEAKFYSGCVLEALSYLHDQSIIYRDLKPENVMVHTNGYLKLTDFGFVKKQDSNEKTFTFVGTAEYVAPEIIQNKGHNKAVDYWTFGIFIFELLVGKTPFRREDNDHLKTYRAILKGTDKVIFPHYVSNNAKTLIKELCMPLPTDRLGCKKKGVEDIRKHAWFSGLDWNKLRNFQLEPPIKPELQHNLDTRYFEIDNIKEDKKVALDDFSNWDDEF